MPVHLAMRHDRATGRLDVGFDGAALAADRTPATPMLLALGADRRAEADDALPDTADAAGRFDPRRGWCLDALDPAGARCGSRLWLLERAKATGDTRARAEEYARQALAPLARRLGLEVAVEAAWLRPGVLALLARAGGVAVLLPAGGDGAGSDGGDDGAVEWGARLDGRFVLDVSRLL